MKKFLWAIAIVAVSLSSCRKDKTEEKDKPLKEYVIGDWNMTSINLSGNIQSPFFSGQLVGNGTEVSGRWTFRENGTVRAETKYKMNITIAGFSVGEEEVDEVIEGTYTVSGEDTVVLTAEGETTTYTIRNRENTKFEAVSTEEFNDMGATGNIRVVIGISR
jgi:hypothetical protein